MGVLQGVDTLYEIEGKVSAVPGDFETGQTSWRTTVDSARTCNSATCSGNWGGGGAFSTPEDPSQAEKSLIFFRANTVISVPYLFLVSSP